jgi:hypothetical protein
MFTTVKDAIACPSCGGRYSPEQIAELRAILMRQQPMQNNGFIPQNGGFPPVNHGFHAPSQPFMPPPPPPQAARPWSESHSSGMHSFDNAVNRVAGIAYKAKMIYIIISVVIFLAVLGGIIGGIASAMSSSNNWQSPPDNEITDPSVPIFDYDLMDMHAAVFPVWHTAGSRPNEFHLQYRARLRNFGNENNFYVIAEVFSNNNMLMRRETQYIHVFSEDTVMFDMFFSSAAIIMPVRVTFEIRNGNSDWMSGSVYHVNVDLSSVATWMR